MPTYLNFLKAFDGTALIKKDNIRIKFEKIEIDQKNLVIKSGNNTEVFDIGKELMLKTNSIVYDRKNKILLSENNQTKLLLPSVDWISAKIFIDGSFDYGVLSSAIKILGKKNSKSFLF